ncbi:substrate-binding domain-containing protein [Candidatus Bipolaricaulota bacterium]|nr:substrate-binding domain-containing protein [Candidatus Bipolaricaulota bacterium]
MSIKKLAGLSLVFMLVLSISSFSLFAQGQDVLRADGSSTVYPIASLAASYWNSNPPIADAEYWPASDYGIDTEKSLADYWASLYGLETFNVAVGLSHSGVGLNKVAEGKVDIGDSSAGAKFEFPEKTEEELSSYTAHIVGKDRQAFSVSKEVYEAGCTVLTKEEIVGIFKGEITNWKGVHSCDYDKEIQAIGRAVGSGTETMFRVNVFGSSEVSGLNGIDVRYGQNQMVQQALVKSSNGIGYPGIDFVSDDNPALEVIWEDGNTYSIEDQAWPLGRPLYMYTWEGTSKTEAAFLRMILSDFGQSVFVDGGTEYFMLSEKEQAEQLEKLPPIE